MILNLLFSAKALTKSHQNYLASILNGMITVAKLSSAGKQKDPSAKVFDKLKLNRHDEDIFIELLIDESNLQELRKTNLMAEPEQ